MPKASSHPSKKTLHVFCTAGEPAGIGTEITLKALAQILLAPNCLDVNLNLNLNLDKILDKILDNKTQNQNQNQIEFQLQFHVFGDEFLIKDCLQHFNLLDLAEHPQLTWHFHNTVEKIKLGALNIKNGLHGIELLHLAIKNMTHLAEYDETYININADKKTPLKFKKTITNAALVTAPIHKKIINDALEAGIKINLPVSDLEYNDDAFVFSKSMYSKKKRMQLGVGINFEEDSTGSTATNQPSNIKSRYENEICDKSLESFENFPKENILTKHNDDAFVFSKSMGNFYGHTEYLAELAHLYGLSNEILPVLMLLNGFDHLQKRELRVALATVHVPLKNVSEKIAAKVKNGCDGQMAYDLYLIADALTRYFQTPDLQANTSNKIIKIAGLNPHAGENGLLGAEENELIEPLIKQMQAPMQALNIALSGCFSGDTLMMQQADCFYYMHHDQGLAPFKYVTFGQAANITLGLPFIRSSVDHGTALELANFTDQNQRSNHPNHESMYYAILKAIEMLKNQYLINNF